MKLKVKRLAPDARMPFRAHESDAGMDLFVHSRGYDIDLNCWKYGSGIAIEIPEGYVGLLFPRSSVFKTGLIMSNCVGVIDSGYRGEVMAKFYQNRMHAEVEPYNIGERFCQLILMPYPKVDIEEAEELSETDRGSGGYGSSGK